MSKAGFWFLFWKLMRAGLRPWCCARMAWQYRGRWGHDIAGEQLDGLRLWSIALRQGLPSRRP